MSIVDKYFYNQASSEKLGWEPDWFGCQYNDDELVKAVKKWQTQRVSLVCPYL